MALGDGAVTRGGDVRGVGIQKALVGFGVDLVPIGVVGVISGRSVSAGWNMGDDDVRLDLDELGEPAGGTGAVRLDVLDSGDDRPTLAERGRAWWRDTLRPHLRRHRTGWLVACVVVLVGAGSADYWHQRPPAVDPVVRVAFAPDAVLDGGVSLGLQNLYFIDQQSVGADYLIGVQLPGEVVDVLGISGPGLTSSAVSGGHARYGSEPTVRLRASFDCSQQDWWTARDGDYGVKVTRTDSYGRVVHATVPLAIPDATAWREVVQRDCLSPQLVAANFGHWDVGVDRTRSRVTLSVRVTNPASHPIYLQIDIAHGSAADSPPVTEVPAHSSSTLITNWPASSCPDYPSNLMALTGPDDPTNVILLRAGVRPLDPPDHNQQSEADPYQTGFAIPHSLRVHLQAELDRACAAGARTR